MIRFLLVLYSVVIFALLALDVVIDTNQARWAFSAAAAFAASFLFASVGPVVVGDVRRP
jgi:hypothetical protein